MGGGVASARTPGACSTGRGCATGTSVFALPHAPGDDGGDAVAIAYTREVAADLRSNDAFARTHAAAIAGVRAEARDRPARARQPAWR